MTTQKAYVKNWREQPQETHTKVAMEFDPGPERAAFWETREQAQNACLDFESFRITIPSIGSRACKGFGVEERAPKQFVVFCEYPSERGDGGGGLRVQCSEERLLNFLK
jgi:hypothetical protein